MKDERTVYVERSPWPGFVSALVWSVAIMIAFAILAGWDLELPFGPRSLIAMAVLGAIGLLHLVVGGLTVRVLDDGLVLHLGSLPLVKTTVSFDDIASLTSVRYRPIRDFGGWGVRFSGNRRAWTARGDRAVELTLSDDRRLLVGSDHPHRLEERIRAAMGDRGAHT